jgi:hypothetical protein
MYFPEFLVNRLRQGQWFRSNSSKVAVRVYCHRRILSTHHVITASLLEVLSPQIPKGDFCLLSLCLSNCYLVSQAGSSARLLVPRLLILMISCGLFSPSVVFRLPLTNHAWGHERVTIISPSTFGRR